MLLMTQLLAKCFLQTRRSRYRTHTLYWCVLSLINRQIYLTIKNKIVFTKKKHDIPVLFFKIYPDSTQKEIKRNFLDLVYVSELIDTYKAQCSSGTSTYWHLDVIKINVSKNFN